MLKMYNFRPLKTKIGINAVRFYCFLTVVCELDVIFAAVNRVFLFIFKIAFFTKMGKIKFFVLNRYQRV